MTNRILIVLISIALMLQAITLYKQHRRSSGPNSPVQPTRDPAPGTAIDLEGLPIKGSGDARIVMIEFSDYECPFCARHAMGVGKDIEKEFVSTGKVRHAFVNHPLPIHPNARLLATV